MRNRYMVEEREPFPSTALFQGVGAITSAGTEVARFYSPSQDSPVQNKVELLVEGGMIDSEEADDARELLDRAEQAKRQVSAMICRARSE